MLALGMCVFAGACKEDEGKRIPLQASEKTLPEGHPPLEAGGPALSMVARAALDSGNAAYRAKNFDLALRHYRDAARAAPTQASPWFGIFMVAQATQNTALADSARKEVQKRTVDAPGVSDSTLRSTHPAPARPTTSKS